MKLTSVVLGFAFLMTAQAWAGQEVGNGGDLLVCQASPGNPFYGILSLDYVLTYRGDALSQPRTLTDSLDRIEAALLAKVPGLVESFQKFRRSLFNEVDTNLPYL